MEKLLHKVESKVSNFLQKVESKVRMTCFRAFFPVLLFVALMMLFFLLCHVLGGISFFFNVLSKVAGAKALSLLFSKMGCSSPLAFVIGCAFQALFTTEASPSPAHWMLPGPSHQPHVAEEDYLRDHPVAHRSAPPVGLELIKPVIEDGQRYDELEDRLKRHFVGGSETSNRMAFDDMVEKQHIIEKSVEEELLIGDFRRDRIFEKRYEIRECLFYRKGVPLKEKTLDSYLKEIQKNPTRSKPHCKILRKIKAFKIDLFF
uniref:hypothetical protein n=1 Tax=Bidens parviflora TaxID=1527830 RepID=UPI001FF2B503|nr:hypothetical protein MFQ53_mgp63 [Bidens parviflora]UIR98918.1 hypothetical protein [Bidens parviflora]